MTEQGHRQPRPPAVYVLLVLLTAALYRPLTSAHFVYDDAWFIVRNPAIRSISPMRFFTDPQTGADPASGLTTDVYRPLTVLAFALDHWLWDLRPFPYHLENLLWHAIAGFLFWNLLRHLLKHETAALIGAAVFLWHPVQVQTVAWASQRSTLLGTSAMLASLWCFLRFPERPLAQAGGTLLYMGAVFFKESMIVLPAILWLIEFTTQRKTPHESRAWTKYVALGLAGAGYLFLRHNRLHQWTQFAGEAKDWVGDTALGGLAFCVYLGKLFLPILLRPSYDYPAFRFWSLAGSALVCLAFLSLWLKSLRSWPMAALGLGWIGVALTPALQVFPIRAYVAERFLYVPAMGLAVLASWFFIRFPAARWVVGLWLVFLAGTTALTAPRWKSDLTLWAYAIQQEPTNAFAHLCYAEVAPSSTVAEAEYKKVLVNRPTREARFSAMNNLAWLYLREKRPREALFWARQAVALDPKDPRALYNLRKAEQGFRIYRRAGR